MAMTAPTISQIKAQVAAIRQKLPRANVIGLRSPSRWAGETITRTGGETYAVWQCDSPLSFRLALREPVDEDATKVLITPLEDQDLGEDVLLRLAKRRLLPIDPWQIVLSLFAAHTVDPRLTQPWIAEALLEFVPAEGYPAARGGFLDAENVWPLLLKHSLGMAADVPDLASILRWSLDPAANQRFRLRSVEFRQGVISWLAEQAGPAAELVLRCLERLDRPDAAPIGLAATVMYHEASSGRLEKATGKLEERFLGGDTPAAELMRRWSAAATEVVRALQSTDARLYQQNVRRGDEILQELGAEEMAHLSDTSSLGFDQRLARAGESLSALVAQGSWDLPDRLVEARKQAGQHDRSRQEARRLERLEMAVRLVRWLAMQRKSPTAARSFTAAAEAEMREGGFVDWARLSLRSGDPVRQLSEAYARLFEQVRRIREQQSQEFAKLLADWRLETR